MTQQEITRIRLHIFIYYIEKDKSNVAEVLAIVDLSKEVWVFILAIFIIFLKI